MHYVTHSIKIINFTTTKYLPKKIRKTIFMRYRRQSVLKHCTKLALSALHQQYIWLLVLDLNFSPQAVLALPACALGWDDPHQLQQGDGGHNDDHLLGGKKGCMLLPELFAAH